MKNKQYVVIALVVVFLLLGGVWFFNQNTPVGSVPLVRNFVPSCWLNDNTATTTPTFLTTSGGTVSMTCLTDGAEDFKVDILSNTASTTATVYNLTFEFAEGRETGAGNCILGNCQFFGEDLYNVDTPIQVTHGSTTPTRKWTPETTDAIAKSIIIKPKARFTRVNFSVTEANGAIWAQGSTQ